MLSAAKRAMLSARLREGRAGGAYGLGPVAVPLNDGPSERAMFVFHALGGTVFPYGHLAQALEPDFRVFGVPSPSAPESQTLDSLVRRHLGLVRRIQPAGPYRLAGWSMGGILAFEIAQRLESMGETVALVGLLDSPFWLPAADPEPSPDAFAGFFVADVARSLRTRPGSCPDPAGRGVDEQLRWLAGLMDTIGQPELLVPELRERFATFRGNTRLLAGYQPTGILLADALIADVEESPNSSRRWREVIRGGTTVVSLPGNHYTFLQPPLVTDLAAALRTGAMARRADQ